LPHEAAEEGREPHGRFLPAEIVADAHGRAFIAENFQGGLVTVVDGGKGEALGRWRAPLPGRAYLCLSPDQRCLYLGSSGVAGNVVYALDIAGDRAVRPAVVGKAASTPEAPVRGENFVTPDGQFLINRTGTVFRITPPSEG
jgi:hypothetical protein